MRKYFLTILFLTFLFIGLSLTLILTRQRQEIRKKAAVPGGVGKISLSPLTVSKYTGEMFSARINFRTGTNSTNALSISGLSLRITYPYSGAVPELDVVDDSNGDPSDQIYPNSLLSSDWLFPVKSVSRSGGVVTIDLMAINTNILGYKSFEETHLATIFFKANRPPAPNPIVLTFDLTESKMMTKSDLPQDILDIPVNGSYSVQNDIHPPAAITDLVIANQTWQSLTLSWTAPSDSGPAGQASSYDLRYSTATITNSNWSSANQVLGEPVPVAAGTSQTFLLTGLAAGTTYYVALKSSDTADNVSNLSNVPNGSTLPATLSFRFTMQGIGTSGISKSITVTLKGTANKVYPNVSFQSGNNGIFTPVSPLPLVGISIPSGGISVNVLVKDNSHLQKNLGTLTLIPGNNTASSNWDTIIVKAGDFNNDNKLRIDDISQILTVYTSLSVPVNETNRIYDIDSNNVINITDIATVLGNYTALTVPGDE